MAGQNFILSTLVCCLYITAPAHENYWFSNIPPEQEAGNIREYGMHHLSSVRASRGQSQIVQWLRSGNSVEKAAYVRAGDKPEFQILLFSPSGRPIEGALDTTGGFVKISYLSEEEGYYNGYLVSRMVSGDTLHIEVAKAEMLNHSCRNGHKNVRRMLGPETYPDVIPFEIVRKRLHNENFHYFVASGDRIDYLVRLYGEPVNDATVALATQKGWQITDKTGEKGTVSFQFLQDYFSPWREINKRELYYYLITASVTRNEQGTFREAAFNVVHYTTSLSDAYIPAKSMYQSTMHALGVFLLITAAGTTGIWIYRRSRRKPFKEIVFDEKN